jgi:uncharacterized protein with von Willebrand factor type A (vWA) domain
VFLDFFYLLRANRLKVSTHEWLVLNRALVDGHVGTTLMDFYRVAKALLIKSENYFDIFDQCFAHYFRGVEIKSALDDELKDWLDRTPLEKFLSSEELAKLKALPLEELLKQFEERLQEQDAEHNGGNRWIGTGGTSPFGHGGFNPAGIRVGGQARNRSAVKIASERRFREYRSDITLDIRQIQMALRKLRELRREGAEEELDLEQSIDKTCQNAGDIDLIFKASRKNRTKVLLLMDVGGTMDPYAHLVSLLFSAASKSNHFQDFKSYYFHNCVYSRVYEDALMTKSVPTAELIHLLNENYKLIFVGDAWMSPSELYYANGQIDFYASEMIPGFVWLKKLREHFHKAIWLNPENPRYWGSETISAIASLFPMFPLTIEGLDEAIHKLKGS